MSSFGLSTAEALLEIGRPAQAREYAAGYLAGHPEDARGLRLIARCYEATDEYGPMLEAARAALAMDTGSYQGHLLLSSALIHMRRYAEAVEVAAEAIRLRPQGWRGYLLTGVAQCALGRRRAGMAAVNRAVALAPDEPHTHYVQALLRHSVGNRLGAKRAYRRALGLAPGHAGAQRGLGHLALAAGRLVDAVGHFTGAAAAEPSAGGGGLERALLGIAGWAVLTSWALLFTLLFSMFPGAWLLAGAAAGGYAVAAVRFWRRVPDGGRLLLRARLTRPRLFVRLATAAVGTVVALGVGIADLDVDPEAAEARLWPSLSVLGLTFLASVAAVLVVDMVDRPRPSGADPAPEPPDAPLQHATARLTWRLLRAAAIPAAVLVALSTGGVRWPLRAVVGTALIAGYGVALARIRRAVLREPIEPSHVLGRLIGPLSLAAGTLLIFLPMGAYWPGDVPDLAEGSVLVILGALLLGYLFRVPVSSVRWLWRRLRPVARLAAGRLRPAAGRPGP
jgi:tetratricopeptide (TPR) repeat protein